MVLKQSVRTSSIPVASFLRGTLKFWQDSTYGGPDSERGVEEAGVFPLLFLLFVCLRAVAPGNLPLTPLSVLPISSSLSLRLCQNLQATSKGKGVVWGVGGTQPIIGLGKHKVNEMLAQILFLDLWMNVTLLCTKWTD